MNDAEVYIHINNGVVIPSVEGVPEFKTSTIQNEREKCCEENS